MTSIIDVSAAVTLLSVDTISVSRRTRTFNTEGVLVLGAATTISMSASVQTLGTPNAGANVSQERQAQLNMGDIVTFTILPLLSASSSQQSDEVTWSGTVYTVVHVDAWPMGGYYRSVCRKKNA